MHTSCKRFANAQMECPRVQLPKSKLTFLFAFAFLVCFSFKFANYISN